MFVCFLICMSEQCWVGVDFYKVSPAELTKILTERIANFSDQADVQEVGRVLSVGDGIPCKDNATVCSNSS